LGPGGEFILALGDVDMCFILRGGERSFIAQCNRLSKYLGLTLLQTLC
jgi:hypothetical protein